MYSITGISAPLNARHYFVNMICWPSAVHWHMHGSTFGDLSNIESYFFKNTGSLLASADSCKKSILLYPITVYASSSYIYCGRSGHGKREGNMHGVKRKSTCGSSGAGDERRACKLSSAVLSVNAGLHWSFRMSKQMAPFALLILGCLSWGLGCLECLLPG